MTWKVPLPGDTATDVQQVKALEEELIDTNEKMQDIINAIPGGVAVYKVSDIFETIYFSDGVPELTGYTVEEYRELIKGDAAGLTYPEDTEMVVSKVRRAIRDHCVASFEFRKLHRDGHIVWVHVRAKQIGEADGCPLIHCVFQNISDLKETRLELDHLVNSIPGGIASYRVEGGRFIPDFFSDGVPGLSGHTRVEFQELVRKDALDVIYEPDRARVLAAAQAALLSGEVLDVSYRMRHKDGSLIWIHLNGRRMGPLAENTRFYAVFTGMSSETRLFQSIANEAADGIYVIDKQSYELLYVNECKKLFTEGDVGLGQKCYAVLHGKSAPCEFCTLKSRRPDGEEHWMAVGGTERFYSTRFRETTWNGIPAYVKYVRDVTEEVKVRREKERLEQYFQTVVKNLPGGVAVVQYGADGSMRPEYLSDGFAAMTGMTVEEAWALYQRDAMTGVHPDDQAHVREQMNAYIESGEGHCEIVYRLCRGDGSYVWVKNTLTLIQNEGGERRVYAVYHDMTREREEQDRLRQQYKDLILRHYSSPDPNALIIGHCNITQNRILEILDYTNSDLLETFGEVREDFFKGIASLVASEEDRQRFQDTYLNEPSLRAFSRDETELIQHCFIKLPRERLGRFVQFKVNLVKTPDTGDVTGILTVTDITEQTISERIMHQLSVTSYDLVVDLDLGQDRYTVLSCGKNGTDIPLSQGLHSERVAHLLRDQVVPRDSDVLARLLDREYMLNRLERESSYSFSYSLTGKRGDVLTKTLTVSAIDLRLGRVCLSRTDITDSIREQQALLRVIAYTFELAAFIDIDSRKLTLYTRQTVLENLPPHYIDRYDDAIVRFVEHYSTDQNRAEMCAQFQVDTILKRLGERPTGYDFLLSYQSKDGERYKQIDVMWGDADHKTLCLVRADMTDMLMAERKNKKELEEALVLTEEANRAKSDFLSAMSHDIRTPMNAIMGMTALATAHLDDQERVADCLKKISVSSKHLLSLINDILDMSKIERSKITLNRMRMSIPELMEQLKVMMLPQARSVGLQFDMRAECIDHAYFYGDSLRISQILINILSNAIKYTPEGGRVDFLAEELTPHGGAGRVRYCFTVRDTGIGMSEEFINHIFDPFTRSSGAARIEGTGLGLSITKGLVDLMGGVIAVESELSRGTVFRVELECELAQDARELPLMEHALHAEPKAGERIFAGRRILIAEDNAINAEILCGLLELFGICSVVRTDGATAVKEFRDTAPGTYDAILMDIQMPEMNGYEATRAIRETDRSDAAIIPIIAMTANAFAEDVQASLEAGMTAHVAKPIDVDMLRAALSRAWK